MSSKRFNGRPTNGRVLDASNSHRRDALAVAQPINKSRPAEPLRLEGNLATVAAADRLHDLNEEFGSGFQRFANACVPRRPLLEPRRDRSPALDIVRGAVGHGCIEADLADRAAFVSCVIHTGAPSKTRLDDDVAIGPQSGRLRLIDLSGRKHVDIVVDHDDVLDSRDSEQLGDRRPGPTVLARRTVSRASAGGCSPLACTLTRNG
jgi:hypothetical protein